VTGSSISRPVSIKTVSHRASRRQRAIWRTLPAGCLQEDQQADGQLDLLEEHCLVGGFLGKPGMGANEPLEVAVLLQLADGGGDRRFVIGDLRPVLLRGLHQPAEVLVRGEGARPDQLRHGDLGVDGAAELLVARPLGADHVVGRGGGQRDDPQPGDLLGHPVEGPPPGRAQVVGLVEDQGPDARLFDQSDDPLQVLPARGGDGRPLPCPFCFEPAETGVQRLVGDGGEDARRIEPAADPGQGLGGISLRDEIDQAPDPLVPDDAGGGEDEAGPAEPAEDLQAEGGLAGSGGGDDVQPVVAQVAVDLVEKARLVGAPGVSEFELSKGHGLIQRPHYYIVDSKMINETF
jgi:hypothetical protein